MSKERDPIREAHRQWVDHGWSDAADGMAMVTSIVRVHRLLMERIDAELRPLELSFARFEMLRLLDFTRSGSMRMTRLGSLLQVHPTSVTSAVDRLVKQGHVERLRRESDRRVILASITSSGREVTAVATDRLNTAIFSEPGLPAADVATMTRLLTLMRAGAGDIIDD